MTAVASPEAKALFGSEFFKARAELGATLTEDIRVAGRRTQANPAGEDEAWWLANGPLMVQRWMDWRQQSGWSIWTAPDGRPGIELELHPVFDGVEVRMFLDRVMVVPTSGSLVIVDLKSGRRSPGSDFQLGFYRAGVEQTFGVSIEFGAYWMARLGEMKVQEIGRFTPGVMSHWLKQFAAARRENIYVPHLTDKCRACGVHDHCYAFGGRRSAIDPDSEAALQVPQ